MIVWSHVSSGEIQGQGHGSAIATKKDSLRKGRGEASSDNREGSIGGGASLGPKVRECPPAGLESSTTPSWHVRDSREVKLVS